MAKHTIEAEKIRGATFLNILASSAGTGNDKVLKAKTVVGSVDKIIYIVTWRGQTIIETPFLDEAVLRYNIL
jgi:hypothetical protein